MFCAYEFVKHWEIWTAGLFLLAGPPLASHFMRPAGPKKDGARSATGFMVLPKKAEIFFVNT